MLSVDALIVEENNLNVDVLVERSLWQKQQHHQHQHQRVTNEMIVLERYIKRGSRGAARVGVVITKIPY